MIIIIIRKKVDGSDSCRNIKKENENNICSWNNSKKLVQVSILASFEIEKKPKNKSKGGKFKYSNQKRKW